MAKVKVEYDADLLDSFAFKPDTRSQVKAQKDGVSMSAVFDADGDLAGTLKRKRRSTPIRPVKATNTGKRKRAEETKVKKEAVEEEYEDEPRTPKKATLTTLKRSPSKSPQKLKERFKNLKAPTKWQVLWDGIEKHRERKGAPVDEMGCEAVTEKDKTPQVYRFQTLVAAMLSSQTKDAVTAQATRALREHGLNVPNILQTDEANLEKLIYPVSFYRRKATYLKKTAQILHEQYNDDIPKTEEELLALPGVGQKMAALTLNVAWNIHNCICVDIHVHRICNRLGWVKTNTPEETRYALEAWLPQKRWPEINLMLVGFGQTVCKPVGPSCQSCPVKQHCPKIGTKSANK